MFSQNKRSFRNRAVTGRKSSSPSRAKKRAGKQGNAGSPGSLGRYSMLLALEPRFMFDAAVAATAAEVMDQAAETAAFAAAAEPAQAQAGGGAETGQTTFGAASFLGIQPMSGGYLPNEQPAIDGPTAFSGNEDTRFALGGSGNYITVDDPEGDTLQVTLEVENGKLFFELFGNSGVEIIGEDGHPEAYDGNGYSKVTLEGEAGHLNAVLKTLKYQGDQDFNGADKLSISVIEKDERQAAWHEPATREAAITVNAVNDPPKISGLPTGESYWMATEDTPMLFGDGNKFMVSDVDGDELTLTLTVENGKLSFGSDALAPVEGSGGGGGTSYTLTGTADQINEMIASMSYQGEQDFNGSDNMHITLSDSSAPELSADVRIQVASVDDPSVWEKDNDQQFAVDEGGSTTITKDHLNIKDVDTDPNQIILKIESVPDPDKGVVQMFMGGVWVTLGEGGTISYQDIISGRIRYQHGGEQVREDVFAGSGSDKIIFSVEKLVDKQGAPVPEIVFNVKLNPVNDAPSLVEDENRVPNIAYEGQHDVVIKFDIEDADQKPGVGHQVTVTSLPRDGELYYDNGSEVVKVKVGDVLDMERVKNGALTYNHNGNDGAAVGQPLGGTRPDGFTVSITDDGGGAGNAITLPNVPIDIEVRPSNDLPVLEHSSDIDDSHDLNVNGYYSDFVLSNNNLLTTDVDSLSSSITYTLQAGAYTGALYYREGTSGNYSYRVIQPGQSFTQADIDAGKIVYRYHGGFDKGEVPGSDPVKYLHQGTDSFKFTVRDGSISLVDENGKLVPGGFEGGVGKWVDGQWKLSQVTLDVNVNFQAQGGGEAPPPIDVYGESKIVFDESSDCYDKVYEGGRVNITNEDLRAHLEIPVTSGETGQTTNVSSDDPTLRYRITDSFEHGTLYLRVYERNSDGSFKKFTGEVISLPEFGTFLQQDLDVGALYYEHNGEESFSDSMTLTISDGTRQCLGDGGEDKKIVFNIEVIPVNDTPTAEGSVTVKEGPTDPQRDAGEGNFGNLGVVLDESNIRLSDADGSGDAANGYGEKNDLSFAVIGKPAVGGVYIYDDQGHPGGKDNWKNWKEITYASESLVYANANWSGAGFTVLTQADLAEGNIRYVHNGDEVYDDVIKIVVNDNKLVAHSGGAGENVSGHSGASGEDIIHNPGLDDGDQGDEDYNLRDLNNITGNNGSSLSGVIDIEVKITPVNDAPKLSVNGGHSVDFGNTAKQTPDKLTPAELEYAKIPAGQLAHTDVDNTDDQLIYRVTKAPEHGTLFLQKNDGSGTWVALGKDSVFSQDDINEGRVCYIHDGVEDKSYHRDTFNFILGDGDSGKNLAENTFNITIDRSNLAPTIAVDGNGDKVFYLERPDGLNKDPQNPTQGGTPNLKGIFTIGDPDYNHDGHGIGTDEMQVTLTAKTEVGDNAFGYFEVGSAYQSLIVSGSQVAGGLVLRGSLAELQAALDSIAYMPKNSAGGAIVDLDGQVNITLLLDDLGNGNGSKDTGSLTDTATIKMFVSPENNAPTFDPTSPGAPGKEGESPSNPLKTKEDTPLTIKVNNGSDPLKVGDSDDFNRNVNEVTLEVTNGTLNLQLSGARLIENSALGTSKIVLRGTRDQINDALKTLTYTPKADYVGDALLTVTYIDGNENDWGTGTNQAESTGELKVHIEVTPVNDAPTLKVPDQPLIIGKTDPVDIDITVDDIDLTQPGAYNDDILEITLEALIRGSNTQSGTLSISYSDSAPPFSLSGNGTGEIVLVGTRAQVQAALATLKYQADSLKNYDHTVELTIKVNDHDNGSESANHPADSLKAEGSVIIHVSDANDPPEIIYSGTTDVDEDSTAGVKFNDANSNKISINDPDALDHRITVTLTVEHGTLTLGATSHFNRLDSVSGDGGKTITITASQSSINKALDGLTYKPDANWNGTDKLTVHSNDLGNSSVGGDAAQEDTKVIDITVNPKNDAPTLSDNKAISLGDIAEDITGAANTGQTVGDLVNGRFRDGVDEVTGGSGGNAFIGVWVKSGQSAADKANKGEWQYLDTGDSTWKEITNGMFLNKDTNIRFQPVGDYNSETQNAAGNTYRGTVPSLKVSLVESNQYARDYTHATDCDLTTGTVYLAAALLRDGAARYTGELSLNIKVTAVNDAPEITYGGDGQSEGSPITVNEDAALSFNGANKISFADLDVHERTGGKLSVTLTVSDGTLTLGNTAGVTGYPSGGGKTFTITGSVTDINNAVASLKYQGDSNYNGTDKLTVSVSDQGYSGSGGALADSTEIFIRVDPVNDAPVITGPPGNSVTLPEDGSLTFSDGIAISISDPDINRGGTGDGNDILTVELAVGNGLIKLGSSAGLTALGGTDFSLAAGSIKFSGTQAAVNAALKTLAYTPATDWNGSTTLTVKATDDGSAGSSGALSDNKTITVNVTAVNDAPEVASGKGQITLPDIDEDSSPTGASVGSIFGDSFQDTRDNEGGSTANGLAGIVVVGNTANAATEGSWQYHNGSTWVNIGTGRSDANALYLSAGTSLRFLPAEHFNGDPPKLTVRLVDDAAVDAANNPNLTATPADFATVNISGKVGGTTRYSADTVDLFQPVTAVNDAPLVSAPSGVTLLEDGSLIFNGGNTISISDPDITRGGAGDGNDILTVELVIGNGLIKLGSSAGLTALGGTDFSLAAGSIKFSGTRAAVNDALKTLAYTPDTDWNGNTILTVKATDDGSAGTNGLFRTTKPLP